MVKRLRLMEKVSSTTPAPRSRMPGASLPAARPYQDLGTTGTAVFGGTVQQKDSSTQWRTSTRYKLTSEILSNVSIVAASVRHFLNLLSNPTWKVTPCSDSDKEAIELAEFVDEVLFSMDTTLHSVVRHTASFQFHGFCLQEWRAKKRDDGRIGLMHIKQRPQHTIERWEVAEDGTVLGVYQRSPQTNQLLGLPRSKLVYSIDDTFTDSPEGFGVFRQLIEPYNRLAKFLKLETQVFERDLRGIPIGRAPLAKLREDVDNGVIDSNVASRYIQALTDFIELQSKASDTALLLDSQPYESQAGDGDKISSMLQWGIDLLQGQSNGLPDLAKAIDRIQREMARIIGTEHLMLGDQGGNRALSVDKSRNLYLMANAILRQIASTYDRDIISVLWKLNGFPEDKKPWLSVEDVTFRDIGEIAATLRDMATAGAIIAPDDPAIGELRDLMGLSRPEVADNPVALPVGREQLDEDSDMDDDEEHDEDLEDEEIPEE